MLFCALVLLISFKFYVSKCFFLSESRTAFGPKVGEDSFEDSEEEEGLGDFLWIFFFFAPVTFFCDMYSERRHVLL